MSTATLGPTSGRGPFYVTSYVSNHARTGGAMWYRVVDAEGKTVRKGFRDRRAAEKMAVALRMTVTRYSNPTWIQVLLRRVAPGDY